MSLTSKLLCTASLPTSLDDFGHSLSFKVAKSASLRKSYKS